MSATEPALGGPSEPVSVRVLVGNALYDAGWMPDEINYRLDQLLAEHAHELAEKQRAWIADQTDMPWWADEIPALIDPKKEGS